MSWNNRPATDTIPFLSPFLAPSARALGPLLTQLATPGPLRATVESAADALRGLSPSLVRQVRPAHAALHIYITQRIALFQLLGGMYMHATYLSIAPW